MSSMDTKRPQVEPYGWKIGLRPEEPLVRAKMAAMKKKR